MTVNVLNSRDWAVFCRRESDETYVCVARFFNRADAEDHLKFLRKYMPKTDFKVLFDKPVEVQG
ncbi:hypothetical protein [Nostoc sp. PCC 7107]|uniref:hypothetical protein n=1 Tax=Nostoc sp. PCC 7107 TaxID=317936 RepID=UPI00029F3AA8|nr:hypothetical protein [Nostoc sp. PCC 7107]AFY43747.1 hypothetical protein Nos7107_3157 [Nostoc sp. PCC 7107]